MNSDGFYFNNTTIPWHGISKITLHPQYFTLAYYKDRKIKKVIGHWALFAGQSKNLIHYKAHEHNITLKRKFIF